MQPSRETTIAQVLDTMADELDNLGSRAGTLQDRLSTLVSLPGMDIPEAQELDYLVQHLDGLAAFLRALNAGRACACTADTHGASRGLRLSRLAARMSMLGDVLPDQPGADAGDLDLF